MARVWLCLSRGWVDSGGKFRARVRCVESACLWRGFGGVDWAYELIEWIAVGSLGRGLGTSSQHVYGVVYRDKIIRSDGELTAAGS